MTYIQISQVLGILDGMSRMNTEHFPLFFSVTDFPHTYNGLEVSGYHQAFLVL